MTSWQFQIFNLFFIVIYQNILLVLISLPAWSAYENRTTPFGTLDLLLAGLFLACTLLETVADQQQWNFQTLKRSDVEAGRTPNPQFLQSGFFRFSRHPNYFFELAQWWIVFLMGTVAAGTLLQWTVVGAFLLSALLIGLIPATRYAGVAMVVAGGASILLLASGHFYTPWSWLPRIVAQNRGGESGDIALMLAELRAECRFHAKAEVVIKRQRRHRGLCCVLG